MIKDLLSSYSSLVQKRIDELLPIDFSDSRLVEAMRYSALSDGKKIRPFLVMSSAEIFNVPKDSVLDIAVAIELIHVYSLIHDDLPSMDDDDFRRGRPSNHKVFGEAVAILAGDALLTYAFEVLSNPSSHKDPIIRCELIRLIAESIGFSGMVGGQAMDLDKAGQKISKEELVKLHRLKTGMLFIAAAESGAIAGYATMEQRLALRYFAHDLGLAFQIRDDILDRSAESKKTCDNVSVVDVMGIQRSRQQLELLKDQALSHLKIFGPKARIISELAEMIAR